MIVSRLPDGDDKSNDFIDTFNLLSEDEQLDFLVQIAEDDADMRERMLAVFRRRGLLA